MLQAYQALEQIFTKLAHLNHIDLMMSWDEATMMPTGGGTVRAQAMATLKGIQHDLLTNPKNLELVEQAKNEHLTAWQQANLIWIEKKIRSNTCLPVGLVKALTASAIESEQAWRHYRAENNWLAFIPYLKKTFTLVKESAQIQGEAAQLSPYDALIDKYCPGMMQNTIDPIFEQLKIKLPPLIETIINQQQHLSLIFPKGAFDITKQQLLGKELIKFIKMRIKER